jgi:hypothetical protein
VMDASFMISERSNGRDEPARRLLRVCPGLVDSGRLLSNTLESGHFDGLIVEPPM